MWRSSIPWWTFPATSRLHSQITHHLSLTPVQILALPCQNTHPDSFFLLLPDRVSLTLTHMHGSHTFLPSTVRDIYSYYVGPWRSKIVVIRKLARHLSLQQPIRQPAPPAVNGEKLHAENHSRQCMSTPLYFYPCGDRFERHEEHLKWSITGVLFGMRDKCETHMKEWRLVQNNSCTLLYKLRKWISVTVESSQELATVCVCVCVFLSIWCEAICFSWW